MWCRLWIACIFFVPPGASDELDGRWATGLENTIVEFANDKSGISAKIIASDDQKNIGVQVIKSVVAHQTNQYKCEIFDPKVGKYFDAKLKLLDPNTLQVRATCCFGLFSETYLWKRL